MCVCFYIYTPYTINEVKHFHKLISTVLPTFLYCSPKPLQYTSRISYDWVTAPGGLTLGDTTDTVPSTPVLRVCLYIYYYLCWVFFHTQARYLSFIQQFNHLSISSTQVLFSLFRNLFHDKSFKKQQLRVKLTLFHLIT